MQYKEYGYIPAALPDKNCFGDSSASSRAQSASKKTVEKGAKSASSLVQKNASNPEPAKPLPAPSQAFQDLLGKVTENLVAVICHNFIASPFGKYFNPANTTLFCACGALSKLNQTAQFAVPTFFGHAHAFFQLKLVQKVQNAE